MIGADDGRSRGGRPPPLPRRAVPARESAHPEADEASRERGGHAAAHRGMARGATGPRDPQHVHRRVSRRDRSASSRSCWRFSRRRSSIASAASPIRPSTARRRMRCPIRFRPRSRKTAARDSWRCRRGSAPGGSRDASATTMTVLVDGHEGKTAIARSAADAPEIDGIVRDCRRRSPRGRRLRAGDGHRRVRARPSREDRARARRLGTSPTRRRSRLRRSSSSRRARGPSSTCRSAQRSLPASRISCRERHHRAGRVVPSTAGSPAFEVGAYSSRAP